MLSSMCNSIYSVFVHVSDTQFQFSMLGLMQCVLFFNGACLYDSLFSFGLWCQYDHSYKPIIRSM